MTTITVTTASDIVNGSDGVTSLREAITLAGQLGGHDAIQFAAGVGTITLGSSGFGVASGQDLTINGDTDGDGLADVTISGGTTAQFDIATGASVILEGLVLAGSHVTRSDGSTGRAGASPQSGAGGAGGTGGAGDDAISAIHNYGELTLLHTIVRDNSAVAGDGGQGGVGGTGSSGRQSGASDPTPYDGLAGGDGGVGGRGGSASAIVNETGAFLRFIDSAVIDNTVTGGEGGVGGDGGQGGAGGDAVDSGSVHRFAGDGGSGGDGGDGGFNGYTIAILNRGVVTGSRIATGNTLGNPHGGVGGAGGSGGPGGAGLNPPGPYGAPGSRGPDGEPGFSWDHNGSTELDFGNVEGGAGSLLQTKTLIYIAGVDLTHLEGDSGSTTYTFHIDRVGDDGGSASVRWDVANLSGVRGVSGADFAGGSIPRGVVNFTAGGPNSYEVTFQVTGDRSFEGDEFFNVHLSRNLNGQTYQFGTTLAQGEIVADDVLARIYSDPGRSTLVSEQHSIADLAGATLNLADGAAVDVIARVSNLGALTIGGDDVTFIASAPTVATLSLAADVNDLNLGGTAALSVDGNARANQIIGNAGANVIDGGAGADRMEGGAGDDAYVVDVAGAAGDQVIEAAGGGVDTVSARTSFTLATASYVDVLRTASDAAATAISLAGNEIGQKLIGNAGANTLNGRGGHDALTGLGGADAFVFDRAPSADNYDHIVDFAHGVDKIRLDHDVFTTLPVGNVAATAFKDISVSAEDSNDRVLYKHTTGGLYYDDDGSGAHAAQLIAVLDNHVALSASDIIVIA